MCVFRSGGWVDRLSQLSGGNRALVRWPVFNPRSYASIKSSANVARENLLDLTKDIHSLSEFKRNTGELVDQMRGSGHPMVLTINGRAELVVHDAASYQKLLNRVDELEAIAGIQRGIAAVAAGHVTPWRQFEQAFRTKHGLPRRPR